MPVFIASLLGGIAAAMSSLVGRVLIALGLGFVTYNGVDTLMTSLRDQAIQSLAGMGADLIAWLGVLQIGTAINIIFSAHVVAMTISGVQGGALRKLVQK